MVPPTRTPGTQLHPGQLAIGRCRTRRSFHAGGQPARAQLGCRSLCLWVAVGDRSFPPVQARVWHGERCNRYSGNMPDSDDAIGQLTIADTTLSYLLGDILQEVRDFLQEAGGRNPGEMTTGKAADCLLTRARREPSLLTPDVTDWLKRAKKAAEKRNAVIHAIARDRCVMCGQATQFEHRGSPVDRSPAAVRLVTSEFTVLIDEGVKLAALISHRLNARAQASAQDLALSTGNAQFPKQVLIGQDWHHCATCSQTGVPATVVSGPAAIVVLPPKP
jgi:hypothetical protein